MVMNFMIIGVARCGTTSLYNYLKQHPGIYMPDVKEPKYFSYLVDGRKGNGLGDDYVFSRKIKDLNEYRQLFREGKNKLCGEASSDYFYHGLECAELIKKEFGDIPIIIMLRAPHQRAFSAYKNLRRDGREDINDFGLALEKEGERIKSGYDWMWHYSKASDYAKSLEQWQKVFNNIKIIQYEEFINSPNKLLNETLRFLGLNGDWDFKTDIVYSKGKKTLITSTMFSQSHRFGRVARSTVLKIVPRGILERVLGALSGNATDKFPVISSSQREVFENQIKETNKLLTKPMKWEIKI